MAPRDLEELRRSIAEMPEVTVARDGATATYRRAGRIFGREQGSDALQLRAPPGLQHDLLRRRPDRYFVPPYVGSQGWIGVRLADIESDWEEIRSLVAACVEDGQRLHQGTGATDRYPWGLAGAVSRASEQSPHLPPAGSSGTAEDGPHR